MPALGRAQPAAAAEPSPVTGSAIRDYEGGLRETLGFQAAFLYLTVLFAGGAADLTSTPFLTIG